MKSIPLTATLMLLVLALSSCATRDKSHVMVVSVKDQKMALYKKGQRVATYPISTSKFGWAADMAPIVLRLVSWK